MKVLELYLCLYKLEFFIKNRELLTLQLIKRNIAYVFMMVLEKTHSLKSTDSAEELCHFSSRVHFVNL